MLYVFTHAHFGYRGGVFGFMVDIATLVFEGFAEIMRGVKGATLRSSRLFPIGLDRHTKIHNNIQILFSLFGSMFTY